MGKSLRLTWKQEVAIVILLPTLALIICHLSGTQYLIDDAFISFRYALHLATGNGLVWNPGGEPTQGYTNFLFVLLLAFGMKLGASPIVVAHVLNAFGLVAICLSFYLLSRDLFLHPFFRICPSAIIALMPLSLQNAMSGLETSFWTGIVFLSATLVLMFKKTGRFWYLLGVGGTIFLGFLTRPETVLLAGIWFLFLLISSTPKQRTRIVGTAVVLCLLGGGYMVWANSYFGNFFPNSFYIKVAHTTIILPGISYVGGFLASLARFIAIILLMLSLTHSVRQSVRWYNLFPYSAVLVLVGFYLFVNPLMGMYYRFLYPVYCLIGAVTLLVVARMGEPCLVQENKGNEHWSIGTHSLSMEKKLWQMYGRLSLFGLAIFLLFFAYPLQWLAQQWVNPNIDPLLKCEMRVGKALAQIPCISNILIAFGDAGTVPYYSGAKVLDVVGLNDNQIAREGSKKGSRWIIDYTLGKKPDLIGMYTYPDGRVFNKGHGVIGNAYTDLFTYQRFTESYKYVGGFDFNWAHLQWFTRKDSAFFREIQTAIQQLADFKSYEFKAQ